jgi:thioredoxin 1
MARQIYKKEEFDQILQTGEKIIVFFTASWCGACKLIGQHFDEIYTWKEYNSIIFLKTDIDECEELWEEQNIRAMPTFKTYKNAQVCNVLEGTSKEKLEQLLNQFAQD